MKRILFCICTVCLFSFFAAAEDKADGTELRILKEYSEAGVTIFPDVSGGKIKYRLYNEFYEADGSGELSILAPLFCPYGTELCFWQDYGNGKYGRAQYYKTGRAAPASPLMTVLNPKDGHFKTKQFLAVNFPPGTRVTYTFDGSDPEASGLIYTEPVLIDAEGGVSVRLKAVCPDGKTEETKIDYTVDADGEENTFEADFVSVLRDGDGSGTGGQPFKILNWHFLEFNVDGKVYFSVKEAGAKAPPPEQITEEYDGVILLPRKEDAVLFWTCKEAADGGVQKIELPAKPLMKNNLTRLSQTSFKISFSDLRYEYYYEAVRTAEPFEPVQTSPKCENAEAEFKIKPLSEFNLNVKVKAFYNGIEHGSFYEGFYLDTLPPSKPEIILSPGTGYPASSVSVSFKKEEGAQLIVKITPPVYSEKDGRYILKGENEKNVDYLIEAYARDDAGNTSGVSQKRVSIGMPCIFADSNADSGTAADGSSTKPFASLKAVFSYLNNYFKTAQDSGTAVTVFLKGSFRLNEALLITRPVKFKGAVSADKTNTGEKTEILLAENTGFVAEKTSLHIEDCVLKRSGRRNSQREVPVIYASRSDIKLKNTDISAEEGGAVLKLYGSHADMSNCTVTSIQAKYCSIIVMDNSSGVFSGLTVTGKGESAAGFSLLKSSAEITDTFCSLEVSSAAHAVEAWKSNINIALFNCIRLPENTANKDSAIWLDSHSKLITKNPPLVRGFGNHVKRAER